MTESTIKDYQKAKHAGGKGQYRKAYRLFSSRTIMSVKATESSEHSGALYVKGNILKSYTGSDSRPATPLPNHMYFETDCKVFKIYFQYLDTIFLYLNPI